MEVYFDDFKVTHIKSPVVQSQDYYPYGAEFNSFIRENGAFNQYKYNDGSELQDELGLEVYLTDHRAYDPWGRMTWWQPDPQAEKFYDKTPYNFSFNNPIRFNDPKGDCPPILCGAVAGAIIGGIAGAIVAAVNDEDVLAGAASGAVSGAIIGSGAGLLVATPALAGSLTGVVATNAAAGYVAGGAGELTKQALGPEEINTTKVVESAQAGMIVNVVAGPAGGVVQNAISKNAVTPVTKAVAQTTANVTLDAGGNVVQNTITNALDNTKPANSTNNTNTNSNSTGGNGGSSSTGNQQKDKENQSRGNYSGSGGGGGRREF